MNNKTLKALFTGAVTLGVASAAFAQGTVPVADQGQYNFFTFNTVAGKGAVTLPGGAAIPDNSFSAQIYYSLTSSGTFTPLSPTASFSGGIVNAGTLSDPNDEGSTVIFYELVVWNTSAGATFAAATGGVPINQATFSPSLTFYGVSSVGRAVLGGQDEFGDTPPTPPAMNAFNNLTLTPVPEPTTIALGGLGAAALLAFRRRK